MIENIDEIELNTNNKEVSKYTERQKREHLRYLQKKFNRPLTAKELKAVKDGKL